MKRLVHFNCEDEVLAGSLDAASNRTGVLIVPGGGQTRFGAHRGFALLAGRLAAAGYPCFRYDRRGVGDSSGEDIGFGAAAPDLTAAVTAFRRLAPNVDRVIGFGLCDGATTLCLHAADAGLVASILANPWVVEAEANEPPPAAIGKHYREQLTSWRSWRRLLTGGIDYRKAAKGVFRLLKPQRRAGSLAERVHDAMAASPLPAHIVLATDDATAIAFAHEWRKGALKPLAEKPHYAVVEIATDAHSFAKDGDFEQLVESCLAALKRFSAQP